MSVETVCVGAARIKDEDPLKQKEVREDLNTALYWDSTFAIVVALLESYPQEDPANIGLQQLFDLVIKLPGFSDDPEIVSERTLLDIQMTWYEEYVNE